MKKSLKITALILTVLVTAIAIISSVKPTKAEPNLYIMFYAPVPPPQGSIPHNISVTSPNNNTLYSTKNITLDFHITSTNTDINYLKEAYSKPSWMSENVTVLQQHPIHPIYPTSWNCTHTFEQVPDGEHNITISAIGVGGYSEGYSYYFFEMTTVTIINFTVDTTPPTVLVPAIQNTTLTSIAVNYTINEPTTKVQYCIDGQSNVTLTTGSLTLTDLSVGAHNITVYAWDIAGNVGSSDMVVFNVEASLSLPIAVASTVSITILGAGLFLYYKRLKKP